MNNRLLALCALATPFCLSPVAFAQQDTGASIFEEITVFEEIIVTGINVDN